MTGPVASMFTMTRSRLGDVLAGIGVVVVATLTAVSPALAAGDTTPPSTPQNVRVTSTTVTTIAIAWNASSDNVGVNHYRVYQDGVAIASPTGPSYTVTGLWPHSTHTFYVYAYDAAGNASGQSGMVTSYTNADTTGPTAPPNLTATFDGAKVTTSLAWGAATDNVMVDHYEIYRDLVKIGTTPNRTYIDTTVAANKTVKYLVMGVDEVGNSGTPSNQVQVITDIQDPTVPTNLRVTATTASSISLAWTGSTDNYSVVSYDVFRNNTKIATQSYATGTTYYSGGLTAGTSYTYYVVARDSSGNLSSPSNTATSTTTGGTTDTQAPSVPNGVAATPGRGSVTVTWSPSSDNVGVTGYAILRNGAQVATSATASWIDSAPPTNVSLTYNIKARDAAANWSNPSTSAAAFVDTLAPSTPTNLRASMSGTKVVLSWTASTDNVAVKNYSITRDGVTLATSQSTSFSDSSAPDRPQMSYRIVALDGAGNPSPPSNEASIPVPATTQWAGGYLSDMTPTSSTNGNGAVQIDKSHGGHTITLDGTRYSKGLGTWAPSSISYDIGGKCNAFTADIGIDDEVGDLGSVAFQVWADGIKVYDSGTMTGATATKSIKLSVGGVRALTLKVVDANGISANDAGDWASPRLKCATFLSAAGPVSYSNGSGSIRYNVSNGGHSLKLNGTTYTKGIGTWAPSSVVYDVDGECATFTATIGVDDEVGSGGSVAFQVVVDGVKKYDSGTMTGATASQNVSVTLTGAQTLELKVVHVGSTTTSDSADWASAKVLCN